MSSADSLKREAVPPTEDRDEGQVSKNKPPLPTDGSAGEENVQSQWKNVGWGVGGGGGGGCSEVFACHSETGAPSTHHGLIFCVCLIISDESE